IVGVGDYDGPDCMDVSGRFIAPGFIDGHFHIESSMLSPPELARAVVPHGTTAIVADPHEIANVLGMQGIRFMLAASAGLPVDFFFMLPSCVPATHMETAGARLTAADLRKLRDEPRVLGLAEMMNYPGVISCLDPVLEKIIAFNGSVRDGHAPLLTGRDLNAYIAAGIGSDHECTQLEEAREKIRLGMHIMIREGTQAKNLSALLPLVSAATAAHCSLVTDDLHPHDLMQQGHMNHLIDLAVTQGLDPVTAIRMATFNTARYFGLKDRGAIAPGYQADVLVLSCLDPVAVTTVFKKGRPVYDAGHLLAEIKPLLPSGSYSPMNIAPYREDSFMIRAARGKIRVIGLIPNQILTRQIVLDAPIREGVVVADRDRDLIKIAVVERHRATGNIGLGLVQGFGLQEGALASSVAHDSHNIICVGCSDRDMYAAVKAVESMKGGLAAVKDGEVLAALPLPIGGLMSDLPLAEVAAGWQEMRQAAESLGCRLQEPFMALSFLALPVIPDLKITDRGLVDVNQFELVPLFV
ncbi:MAG: adenine deaminase, partial [Syntrophus sp. (in: bacteria)]|nr:adenine deaminase [Syntrophus sp. (in: bacteria)]